MKIKVGIVGYGRLGMALEQSLIVDNNFELIKIFTKRKQGDFESVANVNKYVGKIDILFLCVGSKSDLEETAFKLIKNFNLVDVYDNHSALQSYIFHLNKRCVKYKKVCFSALGWDPGIFSLMRGLFAALGLNFATVWGKGVSQGHTNAVKSINGVIDAVQFTVPIKNNIKKFCFNGCSNVNQLHYRLCYVVAERKSRKYIKQQIVNMPNYFKGYQTIVKYVSLKKIQRIKSDAHKGQVITQNNVANFSLNLNSNPKFTALVMKTYARVMINYIKSNKFGAFSILDIPISNLLPNNEYTYL